MALATQHPPAEPRRRAPSAKARRKKCSKTTPTTDLSQVFTAIPALKYSRTLPTTKRWRLPAYRADCKADRGSRLVCWGITAPTYALNGNNCAHGALSLTTAISKAYSPTGCASCNRGRWRIYLKASLLVHSASWCGHPWPHAQQPCAPIPVTYDPKVLQTQSCQFSVSACMTAWPPFVPCLQRPQAAIRTGRLGAAGRTAAKLGRSRAARRARAASSRLPQPRASASGALRRS